MSDHAKLTSHMQDARQAFADAKRKYGSEDERTKLAFEKFKKARDALTRHNQSTDSANE